MRQASWVAGLAPSRPRVFYGWYIVAASVAMNFYLSLVFFQGFQAFFLPILKEFGWSRTFISGAFSLRQLESGIMAPLVGFLVDRWGPRRVIFTGVLIGGAGMVFIGLISADWMFYLAFVVASIGMSGASHGISWPVVVANWFRRLRGRALGMAFLGPVVSGPFLVSVVLLEEALGWRRAIISLGIGLWFIGIPLSFVARHRPEPYGYLPDGDGPKKEGGDSPPVAGNFLAPGVGQESPAVGLTAAQVWHTPAFWILSIAFGAHGVGVGGIMIHQLPLFQSIGFSARESAFILGLIFFLSGIGRLAAGTLMDYLDRRQVLVGVLLLQGASYILLILLSPAWWQVAVFCLTFGVAFGSTIPTRLILIRELFGSRAFGAINGLSQGVAMVPALLGPIIMGVVFDLIGTYTPAIVAFALITFATVPLALLLRAPSAAGGAYR